MRLSTTDHDAPTHDALLVTEPGGHLLEMWTMCDVVPAAQRIWCTIDSAEVHSLLRDEQVLLGHGPTTRNVRNFLRNLRFAIGVVRRYRPSVVLCTGSGIVVPFAWVARLAGARVLYVECGGRVHRPSLSCRLVGPPAHRRYVQWPELAGQVRRSRFHGRLPWERAPTASNASSRGEPNRILLTTGTSRIYAFDRLLASAEHLPPSGLVIQHGASSARFPGTRHVPFLSFEQLRTELRRAEAVVTHAGIGSVMLALAHGHHPIVMPRRPELGECVDDHQLHFARRLDEEGLATVIEDATDIRQALRAVAAAPRRPPASPADGGDLLGVLADEVRRALGGSAGRSSRRRLRSLRAMEDECGR